MDKFLEIMEYALQVRHLDKLDGKCHYLTDSAKHPNGYKDNHGMTRCGEPVSQVGLVYISRRPVVTLVYRCDIHLLSKTRLMGDQQFIGLTEEQLAVLKVCFE